MHSKSAPDELSDFLDSLMQISAATIKNASKSKYLYLIPQSKQRTERGFFQATRGEFT